MLVTTHVRKEPGVCRISVKNLRICYETRIVFVNTKYGTYSCLTFIFIFCFVYNTACSLSKDILVVSRFTGQQGSSGWTVWETLPHRKSAGCLK